MRMCLNALGATHDAIHTSSFVRNYQRCTPAHLRRSVVVVRVEHHILFERIHPPLPNQNQTSVINIKHLEFNSPDSNSKPVNDTDPDNPGNDFD